MKGESDNKTCDPETSEERTNIDFHHGQGNDDPQEANALTNAVDGKIFQKI